MLPCQIYSLAFWPIFPQQSDMMTDTMSLC